MSASGTQGGHKKLDANSRHDITFAIKIPLLGLISAVLDTGLRVLLCFLGGRL